MFCSFSLVYFELPCFQLAMDLGRHYPIVSVGRGPSFAVHFEWKEELCNCLAWILPQSLLEVTRDCSIQIFFVWLIGGGEEHGGSDQDESQEKSALPIQVCVFEVGFENKLGLASNTWACFLSLLSVGITTHATTSGTNSGHILTVRLAEFQVVWILAWESERSMVTNCFAMVRAVNGSYCFWECPGSVSMERKGKEPRRMGNWKSQYGVPAPVKYICIFSYMDMCVFTCDFAHVSAVPGEARRGCQISLSCELPNVGAGNQIQVLC